MEVTLQRLLTLPKCTNRIDGSYIDVKNVEIFGLSEDDLLSRNIKEFLGAETWLDIVAKCYKNKLHIQDVSVFLPIGRVKVKLKFEHTDNLISVQVLDFNKIQDVVSAEQVFYNWLDKQHLEGVSILPFLDKRELALLFKSASNTRADQITTRNRCSQFIRNLPVHSFTLKDVVDRILIFRDGRKIHPVLDDTIHYVNVEQADMLAEREVLACREKINPWDSQLIKNNPSFLNLHVGDCITAMSLEPGFKYLGAWAGFHPRQFNKPIETMVGNNYDIIDIDLARRLHESIQRLLKNGQDRYEYTHDWKGYKWKMVKYGAILDAGNGRKEIIYKTGYPDECREIQTTRFLTLMQVEGC